MKNSRIHVWQAPPEHLTARRVWKSWTYVPILRVLFLLLFFFSAGVVEMNKAELWWFTQLHLELNYIFLEFAWISSRNGKRPISLSFPVTSTSSSSKESNDWLRTQFAFQRKIVNVRCSQTIPSPCIRKDSSLISSFICCCVLDHYPSKMKLKI